MEVGRRPQIMEIFYDLRRRRRALVLRVQRLRLELNAFGIDSNLKYFKIYSVSMILLKQSK